VGNTSNKNKSIKTDIYYVGGKLTAKMWTYWRSCFSCCRDTERHLLL